MPLCAPSIAYHPFPALSSCAAAAASAAAAAWRKSCKHILTSCCCPGSLMGRSCSPLHWGPHGERPGCNGSCLCMLFNLACKHRVQSVHSMSQNLSSSASFAFEDSMARNSRATSHAPESRVGFPLRWPWHHLRSNSLGIGTLGGVQEAELENVAGRRRRRSLSMDAARHWVTDTQQQSHEEQVNQDKLQEQEQQQQQQQEEQPQQQQPQQQQQQQQGEQQQQQQQGEQQQQQQQQQGEQQQQPQPQQPQGEQPLQQQRSATCQQQKHRRPPSKKRNVSFAGIREFNKEHVEKEHPAGNLEQSRQRRNSDGSCPFSEQLEQLVWLKQGGLFVESTSDKLGCGKPEPKSNAAETKQQRRLPLRSRTDGQLDLGRAYRRKSCPDVATMFAMNKSKVAMKSALKQSQQLSPNPNSAPLRTVQNQDQIELRLSQLPGGQLSGADISLPSPLVPAVIAATNAAGSSPSRGENDCRRKSLDIPATSMEGLRQQRRRPSINARRSSGPPVAEQGVYNLGTSYDERLFGRDFAGSPPERRPWILSRDRGSGGKGGKNGWEGADGSRRENLTSQGMKTSPSDTPWQQNRRHCPPRRCVTSRTALTTPLSMESGDPRRPPHSVAPDDACWATGTGAIEMQRSKEDKTGA
ncbi:hypothetical protein DUNSADRAFT_683 [Dunaliella salina]|uniref:Encoded protein n=1 Tax=Dunaliella salina TaxID=3046 RepID=A0ABQ7FYL2_DUNSA|nr:hypothetical protein DUNSADRAFT_683 [Dunaliella salina]|eukprot:KAF5827429.1 hypothetical protein DUNSADRAFT_683 [Dunaliella salina]